MSFLSNLLDALSHAAPGYYKGKADAEERDYERKRQEAQDQQAQQDAETRRQLAQLRMYRMLNPPKEEPQRHMFNSPNAGTLSWLGSGEPSVVPGTEPRPKPEAPFHVNAGGISSDFPTADEAAAFRTRYTPAEKPRQPTGYDAIPQETRSQLIASANAIMQGDYSKLPEVLRQMAERNMPLDYLRYVRAYFAGTNAGSNAMTPEDLIRELTGGGAGGP